MRAASGEPVPDATPEDIAAFEKQLSEGDARGYVSLKAEIDQLRLLSRLRLNALSDEVRAAVAVGTPVSRRPPHRSGRAR